MPKVGDTLSYSGPAARALDGTHTEINGTFVVAKVGGSDRKKLTLLDARVHDGDYPAPHAEDELDEDGGFVELSINNELHSFVVDAENIDS